MTLLLGLPDRYLNPQAELEGYWGEILITPPVGHNVLHFAEAKPEKEYYNGST